MRRYERGILSHSSRSERATWRSLIRPQASRSAVLASLKSASAAVPPFRTVSSAGPSPGVLPFASALPPLPEPPEPPEPEPVC